MDGMKRPLRFVAGSGVGALVAFFIVVLYFPESVSARTSLIAMLAGIALGGAVFEFTSWDFLLAPVSYFSGLAAVFLLIALSIVRNDFPVETLFLIVIVSLLPLYFFRPISVLDALLTGPEYFGGAMTGLALGGEAGLLTYGTAFGTAFIGAVGALGAFTVSILLMLTLLKARPDLKP
jgi:hypothetical protein